MSWSSLSGPASKRQTKWPELDETRSVKVGLDREELMAEFALLAEEERAEMERAQSIFTEAVHHLQQYSQLDLDTIAHLLSVLEESGRDEGGAWEYFFREGLHQVLLVLMNVEEVAEEEKRSDQILRLWERIFRFVFKLSEEDQQVVYDELRRQGMVESLALVMCHQPHHHPILRRAAFLLSHLHAHDLPRNAPREPDDPPTALRMRDAEGLLDRFRSIEAQPAHFSPDLIAQAHPSSFHARTADAWRMKVKMEGLIPSFMSPMQVRRMREACDGSEASSGSEEAHHNQQGGRSDHGEQRGQEKEAKRDEEAERSRKQESDKQASHHNHRHVDREKVRIAEEVVDQGIHASEKAPLLPTHTRHAVHQVVSGDGCCSACVLM